MGIFKDENGNSYGDWAPSWSGSHARCCQRHRDDRRREEVVRPDLLDRFLPRGAVACGARAYVEGRLHLARCGEDSRDYRACGRGGAVVPNVPSRGGCARDDGGIAARPGASAGSSPCLCNGSLDGTDHWTVPNAFAPARGTIPLPRLTRLFSLVKARHRGRRWRAFPILYAVAPCMRGRLRAS